MTDGRGVDLDLLADYIGGALDGTPEAAAVERLIADDPVWSRAYAETSAAMEAVRVDLGALRADLDQMPAEVLGRLEVALAPVPPEEGGTVIEFAPRRRWARRLAPVAVAAGVLICVGLGATLLRQDSGRQDSETSLSGGAGDAAAPDAAAPGSPGLSAGQGAKVAPKVAQGEADSSGSFKREGTAGTSQPVATGIDYTPETLTRLTAAARVATTPEVGAVPEQLRRLTDPSALTGCLTAIKNAYAQPAAVVRLVDLARFEGSPAVVVLLPDTAWVSGPNCGLGGPDTRYNTRTQGR